MAIFGPDLEVGRRNPVQLGAFKQDLANAEQPRAMRITRLFDEGVMLTVRSCPAFGRHAGCHPQPEAENVRHRRVQVERAVRLMAVQIDRDRDDSEVRHGESGEQHAPPRQVERAVFKKIQHQGHPLRKRVVANLRPPDGAGAIATARLGRRYPDANNPRP